MTQLSLLKYKIMNVPSCEHHGPGNADPYCSKCYKLLLAAHSELEKWIREDGHNHCEEPSPESWFWYDCSMCKLQKSEGKVWPIENRPDAPRGEHNHHCDDCKKIWGCEDEICRMMGVKTCRDCGRNSY